MAGDGPWDLADAMTIWAVPGLVDDPAHPALGSVAVVTVIPSMTVHTHDDYPDADVVDIIASGLLARGFALLGGPEVHQLLELPVLSDSRAELRERDARLRITDGDSALYEAGSARPRRAGRRPRAVADGWWCWSAPPSSRTPPTGPPGSRKPARPAPSWPPRSRWLDRTGIAAAD